MRELIAVKSFDSAMNVDNLKRDALLFGRIAVPELNYWISWGRHHSNDSTDERTYAELEWLQEEKIIFEPHTKFDAQELKDTSVYRDYMRSRGVFHEQIKSLFDSDPNSSDTKTNYFDLGAGLSTDEINLRLDAAYLGLDTSVEVCPILPNSPSPVSSNEATKLDVVHVVLKAFPMLSTDEPWECVRDFRDDVSLKEKYMRIRVWMNAMSKGKLSPIEVEEQLESLLADYRQYMRACKIRVNEGVLETVIVTVAQTVESLLKFKLGTLAKSLFTIKHRKSSLMESEQKAPGNNVAFIDAAHDKFAQVS